MTTSRRAIALSVVLATLCLALVGGTAGTATADPQIAIEDVTATPEQPAPDEQTTITVTVHNADTDAFEVESVTVFDADEYTRYERIRDLGTIPPGATSEVPVTVSFEEEGTKELRVVIDGEMNGESADYRYPLSLTVRDSTPQLSVDVDDPVVGAETTANVTIVNSRTRHLQDARLEIAGVGDVTPEEKLIPEIAPGDTQDHQFTIVPDRTGDQELTASLEYVTSGGQEQQTSHAETIAVEESRTDVAIDTRTTVRGGRPAVAADIANYGNVPLTDVVVTVTDDDRIVGRGTADAIPANAERLVSANVSDVDARTTLDVAVEYEAAGSEERYEASLEYRGEESPLTLTGIETETTADRVEITGTVNNAGMDDADAVTISAVADDGVQPVNPHKEYFVGSLPASDFATFDLTVQLAEDTTTVPVRISYVTDGERHATVRELQVESASAVEAADGGSGSVVVYAVGGLVALAVIGIVGYAAYNARRSE